VTLCREEPRRVSLSRRAHVRRVSVRTRMEEPKGRIARTWIDPEGVRTRACLA
jgi:hypothetical protein